MRVVCGLLLTVAAGLSHATIYRTVDAQGVVHFDDHPSPGAQEVHLQEVQTYQPAPSGKTESLPKPAVSTNRYKHITISQPADKDTVRNNDGSVAISIELDPTLQQHHKVQIILDGQPAGEPQAATTFSLKDIYRGTHALVAKVLNGAGEPVGESQTVNFTMHRPMVDQQKGADNQPQNPSTPTTTSDAIPNNADGKVTVQGPTGFSVKTKSAKR